MFFLGSTKTSNNITFASIADRKFLVCSLCVYNGDNIEYLLNSVVIPIDIISHMTAAVSYYESSNAYCRGTVKNMTNTSATLTVNTNVGYSNLHVALWAY